MKAKKDYIAFILIGAGSAWGRAPDKEKAVEKAISQLYGWDRYFDVYDVDVVINLIEVTGYTDIIWDYEGVHGIPEGEYAEKYQKIDRPLERITRHTKPKAKKRA